MEAPFNEPRFPVDFLRAQASGTNEIAKIANALPQSEGDPWMGAFRDATNAQLDYFIDEMRVAELIEAKADAEFVVEGSPVATQEIAAKLLGSLLIKLQGLVDAVALVERGMSNRRRVASVTQHQRLMVQPAFIPGSFGVRFRLQESDSTTTDTTSSSVLRRACALLGDEDLSPEIQDLLSDSLVRKDYGEIIDLLLKNNAGLTVRSRWMDHGKRLTVEQIRDRRDWLDRLLVNTQEIKVFGALVGGSIQKNRFELLVDDDVTYSGTVTSEAKQKMQGIQFGQNVAAILVASTVEHEDDLGQVKTSYTLADILLD